MNRHSPRVVGYVAAGVLVVIIGVAAAQVVPLGEMYAYADADLTATVASTAPEKKQEPIKKVVHVPLPEAVRGIYMSQCAASSATFREDFLHLFDTTELNTVVVDLKDYSGTVAFPSETALSGDGCTVPDFEAFIQRLHEHGVYVIGRMTVFQDPLYSEHYPEQAVHRKSVTTTPWRDHKGLSFIDVGSKPFWEYITELSKEAVLLGVDEINYDYIRYPSDGDMNDVYYTHTEGSHAEQLEKFFVTLTEAMRTPTPDGYVPKVSVDFFGMTATNEDDLNIGQQLERALPYFDYVSPMVYPSHYPSGFHGYENVNEHAYDIVNYSMTTAVERVQATSTPIGSFAFTPVASTSPRLYTKPRYDANALRPWLQSFDYPVAYTPEMVREQIQATHDAGLTSWLFWDAGNHYYSLKQVLTPVSE